MKNSNQSQPQEAHHIAVKDTGSRTPHEEPLNAYMVSPQYLPREVVSRMAPKKPLGSREPVKMYSQIAAMPMAGGMAGRIRRSRSIPVEAVEENDNPWRERFAHYGSKAKGGVLLALGLIAGAAIATKNGLVHAFHALPIGQSKVEYSLRRGAMYKRFGLAESWLKISVPLAILFFLVGLAIFNGLYGSTTDNPAQGGRGSGSGNNGNAVIEVKPNSKTNSNSTAAGQGGSSPQAANSTPAQGAAGGSVQSGGSSAAVGGYGGGVSPTSGGTTYIPAVGGSGGGTTVPSTPTTSGGTGGGTTGGSGGDSGGGSIIPTIPTPTLPTPTIPDPTDCLCGTTQQLEKQVEQSTGGSPISLP